MRRSVTMLMACGIWLAGAGGPAAQQAACVPEGEVRFVCGLEAPEDLVVVPGGDWILAGAYSGSGGVYLVDVRGRTAARAYPSATSRDRLDGVAYPTCPGPPSAEAKAMFQTHGLYLQAGPDAVHHLYAVHHGSRESVEVFEVDASGATPTLTWIGCAVAPDPIGLNSVRALDGGGFIATNFLPRDAEGGINSLFGGEANGELWEWQADEGWRVVPGSEASGANGLEISDAGRRLYVAAWGSQSFFRLSYGRSPVEREEVDLGFRVDNVRWGADGALLAAGQGGAQGSPVTIVVRIDPDTLERREIVRHPDAQRFGAGTVAVEVDDEIWVGSFRGDRIAIFPAD